MDEQMNNASTSSGSKMGLIIGAIILLLVAGAGYYFWSSGVMNSSNQAATTVEEDESEGDTMTAETMPTQTSPETMNTMESSSTSAAVPGAITIDGSNFKFEPNEIRLKRGEKATIVFNNVQGFHDFVVDGMDVKTDQITAGNSATVEFTPTKAGTFEFYCSVGQHRQNGMKGTLIVE